MCTGCSYFKRKICEKMFQAVLSFIHTFLLTKCDWNRILNMKRFRFQLNIMQ